MIIKRSPSPRVDYTISTNQFRLTLLIEVLNSFQFFKFIFCLASKLSIKNKSVTIISRWEQGTVICHGSHLPPITDYFCENGLECFQPDWNIFNIFSAVALSLLYVSTRLHTQKNLEIKYDGFVVRQIPEHALIMPKYSWNV